MLHDRNRSLLYSALALSLVLYIMHLAAHAYSLYWLYWWYDWIMHFLAGVTGGLAAYWVLLHSGLWRRRSDALLLPALAVLVCLMIVGVAWEVFEYAYGITDSHEDMYALDVIHDLIMDGLGAILAVIIGLKKTLLSRNRNSRETI